MSKEKVMKFQDGSHTVEVGMLVLCDNGQSGSHYRVDETTIEKVGNKLVTLKNRRQFYLDGKEKTDYAGGLIYSSKAAYDQYQMERRVINKVLNSIRYTKHVLTYEQAVKIAEILNVNLEDK
jgi:hypothetical protein